MADHELKASQRAFDSKRSEAGHPDLPRADQVCARLRIRWAVLVELSTRSEIGKAISLGRTGTYEPDADWVTDDQISFALNLVATRLGNGTISSAEYRRERAKIIQGHVEKFMPSEDQILAFCGSWGEALKRAVLAEDQEAEREIERIGAVFAALDHALEAHGVIPSINELHAFARANHLALPDRLSPYLDVVSSWRDVRGLRGLSTPIYDPSSRPRPDFSTRVLHGPPQRVKRGYWTEELAIAGVRRFLDSRGRGEPTTRRAYVDWAKGDRDAASASYMDRWLGGFARIRDLAKHT